MKLINNLRFLSQIETHYRMNFWRNLFFRKALLHTRGWKGKSPSTAEERDKFKKQIFREGHRGRETNGQMGVGSKIKVTE